MSTLGTKLKLAREHRGLPARQTAQSLGVDISTVFRWEAGRSKPKEHQLVQLAGMYGYSPDHFMGPLETESPEERIAAFEKKVARMEKEIADLRALIRERL